MHKRMSVWTIVGLCLLIAVLSLWKISEVDRDLNEQRDVYAQQKLAISVLENKQMDLQEELKLTGTDAFIENQARTLYNFMMPDEIRLVIVNPEALYGGEEVPSD